MNVIAFMIVVSAWAALWLAPPGTLSRVAQMIVFGALGTLLTLAGGFAFWWDSSMRPDQKSAFVLICGVLTLASQAGSMLRAVLDEFGVEWPGDRSGKP